MTVREPDGERDQQDDWFAEPEREARLRHRESARRPEADDWTEEDVGVRGDAVPRWDLTRPEAKVGLAIAALAVILLIGLAAGGVFSSGGKKATPPVTTPPTTTAPPATTQQQKPTITVPTQALKPGDKGAQVKLLQQALKSLGYLSGTADGAYGPATEAAVKSFQQVAGLKTDGIAGAQTEAALKRAATSGATQSPTTFDAPTSTLAPGDTGAQVIVLQRELSGLGYSIGTIDGTYGSKTQAAVKAFQAAQGLPADGIVGSQTLAALAAKATSG